jgi:hypothetical protein
MNGRLKPQKQTKQMKEESADKADGQDEDEEENWGLANGQALEKWKSYRTETKHSKAFFVEQIDHEKNITSEIDKKLKLYMSKVSSLEALSTKQSGTAANFSPTFGTTSKTLERTPGTMTGTMATGQEPLRLPGEQTAEEKILDDEQYSSIFKSSQLSPFMDKFATKLFTSHAVSVPVRFPDQLNAKRLTAYAESCEALFKTAPKPGHGDRKKMLRQNAGIESQSTDAHVKRACAAFEKWMSKDDMTPFVRKEIAKWSKEHHTSFMPNENEAKKQFLSSVKNRTKKSFNPEEKLRENTTFNAIFGPDIEQALGPLCSHQAQMQIPKQTAIHARDL